MERTIKRAHLSGELERNRRSYEIYMLYTLQGMKVSEIAKKYGIKISITESGDPKDNAVAERVNNTIKNELFMNKTFFSIEDVRKSTSFINKTIKSQLL